MLKLAASRVPVHLLFCTVFVALCFLPVLASPFRSELIPRAGLVCLFFLATAYAGRWVCQSFLLKGRVREFILATGVLTIGISLLFTFFLYLSDLQRGWSSMTFGVPLTVLFLSMGIFLTTARDSFRKQLAAADIADRQKQSELELLRSQLSPHFLFNTLNNLYGLIIKKDRETAFLVVKLSDLLRYSLSDTSRRFVPMQEEINYINNYIELEKIRLGDRLRLTADFSALPGYDIYIPPMLLIVFVENAFKHSKNSYGKQIEITMKVSVTEKNVSFSVTNSCGEVLPSHHDVSTSLGTGLSNSIRRLDLLYNNQYILKHYRQLNNYFVYLELPNLKDGNH